MGGLRADGPGEWWKLGRANGGNLPKKTLADRLLRFRRAP